MTAPLPALTQRRVGPAVGDRHRPCGGAGGARARSSEAVQDAALGVAGERHRDGRSVDGADAARRHGVARLRDLERAVHLVRRRVAPDLVAGGAIEGPHEHGPVQPVARGERRARGRGVVGHPHRRELGRLLVQAAGGGAAEGGWGRVGGKIGARFARPPPCTWRRRATVPASASCTTLSANAQPNGRRTRRVSAVERAVRGGVDQKGGRPYSRPDLLGHGRSERARKSGCSGNGAHVCSSS